jgi:TPR repeat protein
MLMDLETNQRVNVSELIRNDDGKTTSIHDLHLIYSAYSDEECPIHNRKKAEAIIERLAKLGDPFGCGHYGGILYANNQIEEAVPYLEKGVQGNDECAVFYYAQYLYRQKRYQDSLYYFDKNAKRGDEIASYNAFVIAKDHLDDRKLAWYYLKKSAKQGYKEAKRILWHFSLKDPLDQRDDKIAFEALLDDFKRKNEYEANQLYFELAYTYVVCELSEHQFFKLLLELEDTTYGIIDAKAQCYAFGIGTQPDIKKAIHYYKMEDYDRLAKMFLKYVNVNDPLGGFMEKGKTNKACAYFAGKMLYNGTYGKRDVKQALSYLKKGVSGLYPRSLSSLAHIYLYDETYKDIEEALSVLEEYEYYKVYGDDLLYMKDLYTLYHYGLGVEADEKKALRVANYVSRI